MLARHIAYTVFYIESMLTRYTYPGQEGNISVTCLQVCRILSRCCRFVASEPSAYAAANKNPIIVRGFAKLNKFQKNTR